MSTFSNWMKTSVMFKLIIIGTLFLVLLIPTSMINTLIYERERTKQEAVREVSSKWGMDQIIGTPVLTIPYGRIDEKNPNRMTNVAYAHVLPEEVIIDCNLDTVDKHRGIYDVVLYNTKATIKGSFKSKMEELQRMTNNTLRLDQAFIQLGISDLRGVKENVRIAINQNDKIDSNPGIITKDIYKSGVSFPIDANVLQDFSFECSVNLNGSTSLRFLPYGKQTNVHFKTPWQHPSFDGAFLPDQHKESSTGTEATWKILQLNRNYPQYGLGHFIHENELAAQSATLQEDSSFGLRLMLPVDQYQKTNRTAKYAIMFILLTFVAFFLTEITNRKKIHPIQYLLIGFAVVIFYVLLLSISEHFSFNAAYWIACTAVILLISLYTQAIFHRIKITLLIGSLLSVLYLFFYSILQLEEYSLLMGSVGLFIILAISMYVTRNIDWYKESDQELPAEVN